MLKYHPNNDSLYLANSGRRTRNKDRNKSSSHRERKEGKKEEPTDVRSKLSKDSQDTKKPTESLDKNVIDSRPRIKGKIEKEGPKENVKPEFDKIGKGESEEKPDIKDIKAGIEKGPYKVEVGEVVRGPWEWSPEKEQQQQESFFRPSKQLKDSKDSYKDNPEKLRKEGKDYSKTEGKESYWEKPPKGEGKEHSKGEVKEWQKESYYSEKGEEKLWRDEKEYSREVPSNVEQSFGMGPRPKWYKERKEGKEGKDYSKTEGKESYWEKPPKGEGKEGKEHSKGEVKEWQKESYYSEKGEEKLWRDEKEYSREVPSNVEQSFGMGHFIERGLRPDLARAALSREIDIELIRERLKKQVRDAKDAKDAKDSAKEIDKVTDHW
jgi:hypothetical protein